MATHKKAVTNSKSSNQLERGVAAEVREAFVKGRGVPYIVPTRKPAIPVMAGIKVIRDYPEKKEAVGCECGTDDTVTLGVACDCVCHAAYNLVPEVAVFRAHCMFGSCNVDELKKMEYRLVHLKQQVENLLSATSQLHVSDSDA